MLVEVSLTLLREQGFQVTELILALSVGLVPGFLVFLRRRYDRWLIGTDGTVLAAIHLPASDVPARQNELAATQLPTSDVPASQNELAAWRRHAFYVKTGRAWAFALFVAALGMLSYLWLGPPYRTPFLDALSVAGMTVLLLVWGRGGFTLWQLLRFLREVEKCEFNPPFFRIPHPATDALLRYYSALALGVDTGYGLLAVALVCGPYPLRWPTIIILSILAAYPIVVTIWSVLQIHGLIRRAKQHHLDEANGLVKSAFDAARRPPITVPKLKALQRAMATQEVIQAVPDWPFSARAALALGVAAMTVLTQAGAFWLFLRGGK